MKYSNTVRSAMMAAVLTVSTASAWSQKVERLYVQSSRGIPVVLIQRIEQIDNLDKGDMFGKNNADFYAVVTVNGASTKTQVNSRDDAHPFWAIPVDMTSRYSRVTIRIMDDDGGWERKDDHADINPLAYRKDLSFIYDRTSGTVTGDVTGRLGQRFVIEGGGDDDRARISFSVYKD